MCDIFESTLNPISSVFNFLNSSLLCANEKNSVVHTGVKSPGWLNNELIKSAFINPPPATMNDIPERMKKYRGYAWWLTYQDAPEEEVKEAKNLSNTE